VKTNAPESTNVKFQAGETVIAEANADASGMVKFFGNKCAIPICEAIYMELHLLIARDNVEVATLGFTDPGIKREIYFVPVIIQGHPRRNWTPYTDAIVVTEGSLCSRALSENRPSR
jgi:hypothetical protein